MQFKFIVIHGEGGFLHNFDIGWFNHHQDDPSCWTNDKSKAKKYTEAQIEKMRPMLEGFQGPFTTEIVK